MPRTGFASATKDLVFFSDADGQFDLGELPATLELARSTPVVAGYGFAVRAMRHPGPRMLHGEPLLCFTGRRPASWLTGSRRRFGTRPRSHSGQHSTCARAPT